MPLIPLVELVGSVGGVAPEQIGPIALKVGVIGWVTIIGMVAVAVQPHELVAVKV